MEKGMNTWEQVSDEVYIAKIIECHGNLSRVARELKISRNAVASKVKNNPEIQKIVNDCRDEFIDLAEDRLYGCVQQSSIPAIMFTLKTIGKARGWSETQELVISRGIDEQQYDISVLTEEEREKLDELTAKIYKPKLIEEEGSES